MVGQNITKHMNLYEPLETIGSGSFGVIRKVKRISDGRVKYQNSFTADLKLELIQPTALIPFKVLARKEIDYRKMSEKEKVQLVAEVNILRELRHQNIVRYYERFVDRENHMIYIITGIAMSATFQLC